MSLHCLKLPCTCTHTRTHAQTSRCISASIPTNRRACMARVCVRAWQGVCARVRVCTCLFSLMPCIRWNWLSHARTHAQTSRHLSACMQSNMCALWAVRTHGVPWVRGKVRVRAHTCACVCVLTCFPPAPFKGSGVAKSEEASSHISVLHAIKHVCTWAMRAHACMREVQ